MAIHFLKKGISPEDTKGCRRGMQRCRCEHLCMKTEIQQVYLNGENVTGMTSYEEEVGNMASDTSAVPAVREKLLELQKTLAQRKGCDHGRTGYRNKYSSECRCEDLSDGQRRNKGRTYDIKSLTDKRGYPVSYEEIARRYQRSEMNVT